MRICTSIAESETENVLRYSQRAEELGTDLIEIRFDYMKELPEDMEVFDEIEVPMIATLRTKEQGGEYSRDKTLIRGFLLLAALEGFSYLDIDESSNILKAIREEVVGTHIICSHHDFESTPSSDDIVDIVDRCARKGDLAKAAFRVQSLKDLRSIFEGGKVLSNKELNFVLIGMGALGTLTRIFADRIGSSFTYCAAREEKTTAAGQLDLETMKRLEGEKIVTGITGYPLSHSMSPPIMNAAFEDLSLPGIYLALPSKDDELEVLTDLIRDLNIRGLNVTIPHKERIIPLLDRLDESAEKVGAVNTVVNRSGELVGSNTDVIGIEETFKRAGVDAEGKKSLIIGAGGAARSCAVFLSDHGADMFVYNRTRSNAETLAEDFSGLTVAEEDELDGHDFEVIVNCTPVGMKGFPDKVPIPTSLLRKDQMVMDMVYNPPRTRLLREADKAGAMAYSGMNMLIHQAIAGFEKWTGKSPDYEVMAGALRRELE